MSTERLFISTPVATNRTATSSQGGVFPVYEAFGEDLKWSGEMPLPTIGTRLTITLNSIGPGEVVGYFSSHGFLGLMVRPENPPDWYKKQMKRREIETLQARRLGPESNLGGVRAWPDCVLKGITSVFGTEVKL